MHSRLGLASRSKGYSTGSQPDRGQPTIYGSVDGTQSSRAPNTSKLSAPNWFSV
jgi:hypothetical protein